MNRRFFLAGAAATSALNLSACGPDFWAFDIYQTLLNRSEFSQLSDIYSRVSRSEAVASALLNRYWRQDGEIADTQATVFAPTNLAFSKIPTQGISHIKENPLVAIEFLEYHTLVKYGRLNSETLAGQSRRLTTLEGNYLVVDGESGLKVNDAKITYPDISASNGVIHAIDKVLLPSDVL